MHSDYGRQGTRIYRANREAGVMEQIAEASDRESAILILAALDAPRPADDEHRDELRALDAIEDSFFDVVPDLLCGPNCGRSCNAKARKVWDWLRAALSGEAEKR